MSNRLSVRPMSATRATASPAAPGASAASVSPPASSNSTRFPERAITLARAHSQTPNIAAVVGYIGKNDEVARAVTDWSLAYADLSEQDFAAFVAANSAG